jgi:hypothetical protein
LITKKPTHYLPYNLRAASAGLPLAVFALVFGQGLGIVFGLNEGLFKSRLEADAAGVMATVY